MKLRMGMIVALLWTSIGAGAATRYVSLNGTNDSAHGYDSWSGAATNIHWAVGVALAGETILVTNGTFYLTNNLVLNKAYTLRGVNGRDKTTINGQRSGSSGWHIIMSGSAVLDGLTVSNGYGANGVTTPGGIYIGGATARIYNSRITDCYSLQCAGVSCYAAIATLTNCIIRHNTGNAAVTITEGQAGRNVSISRCTIADNQTAVGIQWSHVYGWAAAQTTVSHCIISNNANLGVSCADGGFVRNCLIVNNKAGGMRIKNLQDMKLRLGFTPGQIVNCTIAGNYGASGGGVYLQGTNNPDTLINCIIYSNFTSSAYTTPSDVAMDNPVHSNAFLYSCLTNQLPADRHCVTAVPQFRSFANRNVRLRRSSPCVDAGTTNGQSWLTSAVDLDGNPRVIDGLVDMGAYEVQPPRSTVVIVR